MMIGGIGGGSSPYAPESASKGGGDMQQLEQQKKAVQEELKRVREDDKLDPEAKKKKIEALQKKLQKIEDAMQKASVDSKAGAETKAPASGHAEAASPAAGDLKSLLQNPDAKMEEQQKQMLRKKTGETGNLLDLYV